MTQPIGQFASFLIFAAVVVAAIILWLSMEIAVRRREASKTRPSARPSPPPKRPRDAYGRFCKRA
jgi:hypothetical protein